MPVKRKRKIVKAHDLRSLLAFAALTEIIIYTRFFRVRFGAVTLGN